MSKKQPHGLISLGLFFCQGVAKLEIRKIERRLLNSSMTKKQYPLDPFIKDSFFPILNHSQENDEVIVRSDGHYYLFQDGKKLELVLKESENSSGEPID